MSIEISHGASATSATVTSALKSANETTGVSFDFLLNMAKRESSLDPAARAKTSSAAGLFQFIEQTWLGAVKSHGAKHGLGDFAADISRNANGRFVVSDGARRDEILNLRFDPKSAAALAGELANDNKRALEAKLGRGVSNAELYAAHFLGASGAATLLKAQDTDEAAALLPKAANANRPVFYDGDRARSVGEVMASIARSMGEAKSGGAGRETMNFIPVTGRASPEMATAAMLSMPERLREGVSIDGWRPAAAAAPEPNNERPNGGNVYLAQNARVTTLPERLSTPSLDYVTTAAGVRMNAAAFAALMSLDPTVVGAARDDKSGL